MALMLRGILLTAACTAPLGADHARPAAARAAPLTLDLGDTSLGWTAESNVASTYMSRVAPGGDVNGDGYADILVGAPGGVGSEGVGGPVFLHLGSASGGSPVPPGQPRVVRRRPPSASWRPGI